MDTRSTLDLDPATLRVTPLADTPAEPLRPLCGGAVHLPGDAGYDAARLPWNVAVDLRPAAVAVPRHADDVVAIVRAALDAGLRIAPMSTGHAASLLALGPLDDVVLVRLSEMTGVEVDAGSRTARVVGGTLWQDVVEAAAPHGLAALHGSSPDVAVAGYCLGGGIGWYARKHGFAAHAVRAVELVTPTGELLRLDADSHADLFWAVRGGGGNFGIVTALEIELFPIADAYAGMLLWDGRHAPEVLRAWAAWAPSAPDEVTTSFRFMRFPPLPDLPEFLQGREVVIVDGAFLGGDGEAERVLAPLRALAPEMDTFARVPAAEAGQSLLALELRQLGGALSRSTPGGGVIGHVDAQFAGFFLGMAPTPEAADAVRRDAAEAVAALEPWSARRELPTFAEHRDNARRCYGPDAWQRLQALRTQVDPGGRMVAGLPIGDDQD
ncbi:MAG: FAD-binding oxidoreductase [Nocardioides sp.]|nr:FAD-binding oxidoreductase [Nocardioides sp.]